VFYTYDAHIDKASQANLITAGRSPSARWRIPKNTIFKEVSFWATSKSRSLSLSSRCLPNSWRITGEGGCFLAAASLSRLVISFSRRGSSDNAASESLLRAARVHSPAYRRHRLSCDHAISSATWRVNYYCHGICIKYTDDNNINDNYKINVAFCHIGKWARLTNELCAINNVIIYCIINTNTARAITHYVQRRGDYFVWL